MSEIAQRYAVEEFGAEFQVVDQINRSPIENSFGAMVMSRELADAVAVLLNVRNKEQAVETAQA